jgi:pimeloyl-ACP methyl ester carboxylesterase
LINDLRAEERIRRHDQFWFYSYPSGYPYPYSAAILRQQLDAAERKFPLRKRMVVIGHSMGGCITRLLITDTGNKILAGYFWEAAGAGADLIRNQKGLHQCDHFQAPPGSRPRHLHLLAAARRGYGKQLDRGDT